MSWFYAYIAVGGAALLYSFFREDWSVTEGFPMYIMPLVMVLLWPVLLWMNIVELMTALQTRRRKG